MFSSALFYATSMLVCMAFWSSSSAAAPPWMPSAGQAVPPAGFLDFCAGGGAGHPACPGAGNKVRAETAAISQPVLAALSDYNATVNRQVRYQSDQLRFRVRDQWQTADDTGDCEDIALRKMNGLVAAGWPPAAFSLIIGKTESGESHAALLLRTEKGDFLLDSTQDGVGLWHESGTEWLIRQHPGQKHRWEVISLS